VGFRGKKIRLLLASTAFTLAAPFVTYAEGPSGSVSYTTFGTPGLIEMPSALSAPDAELATTISYFSGSQRNTITFQLTPRLSGSFRYSAIDPFDVATGEGTYDRSFDLRYRFLDEGRYRPAMAVGLQDFIGTGIYSGEYLVATKTITPRLQVTAGLGWGRYGSYNGFSNPLGVLGDKFKTRPSGFTQTGGTVESAKWFRGDAAFFGGITYQATDRLILKAEYSSDDFDYDNDPNVRTFNHKSPLNFGLQYKIADGVEAHANYLYGSALGVGVSFILNPKHPTVNGGMGPGPKPVKTRVSGDASDLGWTTQADAPKILRDNMQQELAPQGLQLEALSVRPRSAILHIQNNTYSSSAEAIGRAARVMTRMMPASIETFTIVPTTNGIPASAVVLSRTDLERLEFDPDGAEKMLARARIVDAPSPVDGSYREGLYPQFRWSIKPYLATAYFDPDQPIRADIGVEAEASYTLRPGLILSGSVRKKIIGDLDQSTRVSNSVLPRVRSDAAEYLREGDPSIRNLQMAYYFRPGKDLYGRVTAGYLERMFGGVSGELLWKPVQSPFGVGAEINYVKQRDFDQMLGFQDYSVVTGHLSGYWNLGNGYQAQVDVGRYLAGDTGATFTVDRTFANGWKVGAFATFTNVSFEDFGEGSFDKGLRFTIPLDFFLGTPTRRTLSTTLRPLTRDGGARLNVDGRLFETVTNDQGLDLTQGWDRFWR
jgi:hypothetical protein